MAVSLEIRRAGLDDVDALLFLMEQFYVEAGFTLDRPSAASAFRTLLSNPAPCCTWIARSGGEPAGHVVLTTRFTMEHSGLSGQVDDLYVRPQYRRLGVGRSLLDALVVECRARHCKALQVEVGKTNDAALSLYKRYGLHVATDGRVIASGPLTTPSASIPPEGLPVYRLLTGVDDATFCRRVREALALGYRLYGSPSVTFNGQHVIAAQAVVWPSIGPSVAEPR